MYRKHLFTLLVITAACLAGVVSAFAQNAPVNGTVELEKPDKTREKVANALIEVYRMDMKATFPSAKTDSKGNFAFAGMQIGAQYGFSISAPGCAPATFPNIKAGQEKLLFTLLPGDGRKLTEAEARESLTATAKAPPANSKQPEMSEADKKAAAEIEKKNKEIMEKNQKIQAADEIARKSNDEGRAALKAENWDLAITKFDEGVAAVPDYVGSTPVLLNGKLVALKSKGYKFYREGVTQPDMEVRKAKYEEANKYFDQGLAAFEQAIEVIKKAEPATDPKDQNTRVLMQEDLYGVAMEIHRLKAVGGVDYNKGPEAATLITNYIAILTDPAKKTAAQKTLADIMRMTGDFDKAVSNYRDVLAAKPDDYESMAKLGLSLVAQGAAASPEDREKEQEGLNFMQKYTEMSPIAATDSPADKELKQSVKEAVDYLKSQKMAPQKIATPPKKKP